MLQIHDIRETRVYREAKQEGRQEGLEEGLQKGIVIAITKMAAKKMSPDEIATILELDVDEVRQVMTSKIENLFARCAFSTTDGTNRASA